MIGDTFAADTFDGDPSIGELPSIVVHAADQHGVATYAAQIATAAEAATGVPLALDASALDGTPPHRESRVPRAHLQFTDRLWGATPFEAAELVEHIAERTALTVTLHDLPQPSDGEFNLRRRGDAYRRVIAAARGVAVNSEHERSLLREWVGHDGDVRVIPLPVDRQPTPAVRPAPDGDVAVIGFFYPGKGHAEVVAAVGDLAAEHESRQTLAGVVPLAGAATVTGVVALGRASSGHEAELQHLIDEAAGIGVPFDATGYLDDATLLDRARRASVPVAAHQHVSASGSIATWIAAGRRPLVPDTRYSREMAALRPGTLTLYPEGGLTDAIAAALADPASTWWDDDARTAPGLTEVVDAYVTWWADEVRW